MSNMSYCRFRNTRSDLADCADALDELFNGEGEPLSADELDAAKSLVKKCMDISMLIEAYTGEAYDDLDAAQRDVDNALDSAQNEAENERDVRESHFLRSDHNGLCRNCGSTLAEHGVNEECDADEDDEALAVTR